MDLNGEAGHNNVAVGGHNGHPVEHNVALADADLTLDDGDPVAELYLVALTHHTALVPG